MSQAKICLDGMQKGSRRSCGFSEAGRVCALRIGPVQRAPAQKLASAARATAGAMEGIAATESAFSTAFPAGPVRAILPAPALD
jgi:hypothetical protein